MLLLTVKSKEAIFAMMTAYSQLRKRDIEGGKLLIKPKPKYVINVRIPFHIHPVPHQGFQKAECYGRAHGQCERRDEVGPRKHCSSSSEESL